MTAKSSVPVCWDCGIQIPIDTPYRRQAPEEGLPPMVGVIVCSPACPERPDDVIVYRHPNWRKTA